MSNSDWISLGSAIATLFGVGVALYANWQQMRKMNNQLVIQQFSDYTKRYQEIILHFPENINEQTFDFSKDTDKNKTMRYMRAYFDLSFEEWHLNQRKLIDAETWEVWEDGIKTALSKTAFINAWLEIKKDTRYGQGFEQFINASLPINQNLTHHSSGTPNGAP
jgi:hypothetical protein